MNISNYFHYYMFDVTAKELDHQEQALATATTVFLSLFTLGIVPIFCRAFLYDRSYRLQRSSAHPKATEVGQKLLSPKRGPAPTPTAEESSAAAATTLPGGIWNGVNTCYISSALQSLNNVENFKEHIASRDDAISVSLQGLFNKLDSSIDITRKESDDFRKLMIAHGAQLSPRGPDDINKVMICILSNVNYPTPLLSSKARPDMTFSQSFISMTHPTFSNIKAPSAFIHEIPDMVSFSFMTGMPTQPTSFQEIPLEASFDHDGNIWQLRAITIVQGGHHVCYLYRAEEQKWIFCDDNQVQFVDKPDEKLISGTRLVTYERVT